MSEKITNDRPETNATNDSVVGKAPTWFLVVGVIALLWNLMGLLAFVAQMQASSRYCGT